MFHSEMWAVRFSERNASITARHVNSDGHSAAGVADVAGDGFSTLNGGSEHCQRPDLRDRSVQERMDAAWTEFFGDDLPARVQSVWPILAAVL